MAKLALFEYACIYHPRPTKDQVDNHTEPPSKMIVEPTRALCVSNKEAGVRAARAIPADYEDKLDDIDVLVRPF
jgi:hypothetical protein